jgi:hypothetical protein
MGKRSKVPRGYAATRLRDESGELLRAVEQVEHAGGWVYRMQNGALFATPCPTTRDTPIEIGAFGRIEAGPWDLIGSGPSYNEPPDLVSSTFSNVASLGSNYIRPQDRRRNRRKQK